MHTRTKRILWAVFGLCLITFVIGGLIHILHTLSKWELETLQQESQVVNHGDFKARYVSGIPNVQDALMIDILDQDNLPAGYYGQKVAYDPKEYRINALVSSTSSRPMLTVNITETVRTHPRLSWFKLSDTRIEVVGW